MTPETPLFKLLIKRFDGLHSWTEDGRAPPNMSTEQNNARFHSDLSEKHADKVIAYVAKMLTEDVKSELHDAQIYAIEGNDLETAKRLKAKQQMVEETVKNLKRMLLK